MRILLLKAKPIRQPPAAAGGQTKPKQVAKHPLGGEEREKRLNEHRAAHICAIHGRSCKACHKKQSSGIINNIGRPEQEST